MEYVSGVPLKTMWSRMTEVQHIELIASMGKLIKELCALDFGWLGSLYFNTADKPPGTHPIDEKYCIGPHCGRHFWGYNDDMTTQARVSAGFQGPWQDLSAYLSDITHISKATAAQRESSQDLVEEHLQLLETSEKTLDVIRDTTAVQEASKPLLFHPDSHARNIFVDPNDPTKILSIIDWQSTVIEPAFIHANETPDFAEEPVLDKILDAEVSPEVQEAQDHAQRCGSTWAVMAYICPKLGKAITLDYNLCCYLAGISSGCSDDITSLRSLLTDVSNRWEDLERPGVCPYQPSEEEAKMLSLELDHLQSTQRMRMYLSRMLRCETDGWVEKGRWDEVVPIYRDQYAKFVESCIESREEDETEEDAVRKADKLWPFDLR